MSSDTRPRADESSSSSTTSKPLKPRPARIQVSSTQIDKSSSDSQQNTAGGKEYNIWYNKWAGGDREDSGANKVHSQSRCDVKRDSGWTRADGNGTKYCCLYFARGCCPLGRECKYLHRLPLSNHQLPDTSLDCFAREKHADYRDDMGGVGSFGRQNRTLYVGKMREGATKAETEEMVRRHFGEWGEIERLNILHNRGVAFVTYASEHSASFAKEAMSNQSLDSYPTEILNVRWATADPNPVQKRAEKRRLTDLGTEGIKESLERNRRALEAVGGVVDEDEEEVGRAYEALDEIDQPLKKQRAERGDGEGSAGILGGDALENIKYFAEIARAQQAELNRVAAASKNTTSAASASATSTGAGSNGKKVGLGALGDYGSDSDSE